MGRRGVRKSLSVSSGQAGYSIVDRKGAIKHTSNDIFECFDAMRRLPKVTLFRNCDHVKLAFTTGPQGGSSEGRD